MCDSPTTLSNGHLLELSSGLHIDQNDLVVLNSSSFYFLEGPSESWSRLFSADAGEHQAGRTYCCPTPWVKQLVEQHFLILWPSRITSCGISTFVPVLSAVDVHHGAFVVYSKSCISTQVGPGSRATQVWALWERLRPSKSQVRGGAGGRKRGSNFSEGKHGWTPAVPQQNNMNLHQKEVPISCAGCFWGEQLCLEAFCWGRCLPVKAFSTQG